MNIEIILGIMSCILLLIFAILALVITIKKKDGKGVLYFVWLLALLALVMGLTHNNIKQIPLEWTCCNNTINTKYCPDCGKTKSDVWICCDTEVEGNFCSNCGEKRPEKIEENTNWTCSCGNDDATGNYCSNCGKEKEEINN